MKLCRRIAALLLCIPTVIAAEGRGPRPVPGKAWTVPSLGLALVPMKPGSFMMGSPVTEKERSTDETQRKVALTKSFWMGKYEVTQRQFGRVMRKNPSSSKGPKLPVVASWRDAVEFCAKLTDVERKAGRLPAGCTFRLPTEAEWEYACRAGRQKPHSSRGSDPGKMGDYAWCYGNSGNRPHDVGQKKPNAWGLYDMQGNAAEWCWDWYGDYPAGRATNPIGPRTGSTRVVRGGRWTSPASDCRAASRHSSDPTPAKVFVGFRVVLAPEVVLPVAGKAFTAPDLALALEPIKPGSFMMGSPATETGRSEGEPLRNVALTKGFWMGKYEVTQMQFGRAMKRNPSSSKGPNLPVLSAAWRDAMEFCAKLNDVERRAGRLPRQYEYRLPTEAEWEYACRAGTQTAYSFGDEELGTMRGILATAGTNPMTLVRRSPMPGACTTCMAMHRSGVGTGTAIILPEGQRTQLALGRARSTCLAAAIGATAPGSAVPPLAAGSTRPTRTPSWASALSWRPKLPCWPSPSLRRQRAVPRSLQQKALRRARLAGKAGGCPTWVWR